MAAVYMVYLSDLSLVLYVRSHTAISSLCRPHTIKTWRNDADTLKDLCKSTLLHTYMTSHKVLNFAEKDNVAIVVYNAEN